MDWTSQVKTVEVMLVRLGGSPDCETEVCAEMGQMDRPSLPLLEGEIVGNWVQRCRAPSLEQAGASLDGQTKCVVWAGDAVGHAEGAEVVPQSECSSYASLLPEPVRWGMHVEQGTWFVICACVDERELELEWARGQTCLPSLLQTHPMQQSLLRSRVVGEVLRCAGYRHSAVRIARRGTGYLRQHIRQHAYATRMPHVLSGCSRQLADGVSSTWLDSLHRQKESLGRY